MFVSFSEICKSAIEIFWNEVFMVINTVKHGQSLCSAVICIKRSAFGMQFHLILTVVSIFLKTCVSERPWRELQLIARKKDLIRMYRGALVSGCENILVYFNKLVVSSGK